MGARKGLDGLACTQFPSNTAAASIEVMETLTPMTVWAKQIHVDSGGAGEFRGGDGQEIVLEMGESPVHISVMAERVLHPAQGLLGGKAGQPVSIELLNRDASLPKKGRSVLQPGDKVRLRYAGGGGYGDQKRRDREAVARDLRDGVISRDQAVAIYGYAE
jgi:N-methylhydantoinase B